MVTSFVKTGVLVEKKFREFFMPTVLASMAGQLGTIINGIIVGNFIGANAMAAVSACLPLNQITYAVAVLISIGSAALIAIASGARDKLKADYIFSTVVTISILSALILSVIFIPNVYEISKIPSSVEDLRILMYEYLLILVWRAPLYLVSFTWQTLLRTDGMAKIVSRGILIGQAVNVILSFYIPENLLADGATALRLFSISLLGVTITFLVMYYYSTIQRRTVANILSLTEGVLVVVPAAWLLSKSFGLNGVWITFILAELVGLFVV